MNNRFNEELAKKIGETLRKIRLDAKTPDGEAVTLTQADVAIDAGISLKHYQNLELGKCLPSFDVMMRIARSYGKSFAEFFTSFE